MLAYRSCGIGALFCCLLAVADVAASLGANGGGLSVNPIDLVDVFVGTAGAGYGCPALWPGASAPFGNVRLSPDTAPSEGAWLAPWHFGGYHYDDDLIVSISHTHMVGSGTLDLGNVGVMPRVGNPVPRHLKFAHDQEYAEPGYYRVQNLDDGQLTVELTASRLVGVHRYSVDPAGPGDGGALWVSLSASRTLDQHACLAAFMETSAGSRTVRGSVTNNGYFSCGGFDVHFYAEFSEVPVSFGEVANNGDFLSNISTSSGCGEGQGLSFRFASQQVELAVAISYISMEQAEKNLQELPSTQFDTVRQQTQREWTQHLSVIGVQDDRSAHDTNLRLMYTAFYHSLLTPTSYDEAGRVFYGFDKRVHSLDEYGIVSHFYSDMSLWDTHRSQMPLLTSLFPERQSDMLLSMLAMGLQTGSGPPRWPFVHVVPGGMIGNHGIAVFADALQKNVSLGHDRQEMLYQSFRSQINSRNCTVSCRSGMEDWASLGFVATEDSPHALSLTLAYAYDDHSMSVIAQHLGHEEDFSVFRQRSANWKNVFRSTWLLPRHRDGTFVAELDKLDVFGPEYLEGDAWHYRWFVPHAIADLQSLWPSHDEWVNELEMFFALSETFPTNVLPDPYYWAGNEPDILSLYEFQNVSLTQYWLRRIVPERYNLSPSGIPGNDDYGTLSSWWLWYALGVYPVTATKQYAVGIPLFDKVGIARSSGDWIVTCDCCSSPKLKFPKARLSINGEQIDTPTFSSDRLLGAATMKWTCYT